MYLRNHGTGSLFGEIMESQTLTRQFKNLKSANIKVTINKYDDSVLDVCVERINPKRNYTIPFIIVVFSLFVVVYLKNGYSVISMIPISLYAYQMLSQVQYEHLIVVKSLGYQIEKRYALTNYSQFIPWTNVEDIFINEVISIQRVIFMIVFLMEEKDKPKSALHVFESLQPRLDCLELIYQHLQDIR